MKFGESLLTKIASVFSGEGVIVDTTTMNCDVSETTIRIPANAQYLEGKFQRVIHGMLDHEWLHKRASKKAKDLKQTCPIKVLKTLPSTAHKLVYNAYRDVIDETAGAEEYCGVAENLKLSREYATELLMNKDDLPLYHQVCCGLIKKGMNEDYNWLSKEAQEIVNSLSKELDSAKKSKSVEELLDIVNTTVKKINLDCPEEKEEEKEEESFGEGEGEIDEFLEVRGDKLKENDITDINQHLLKYIQKRAREFQRTDFQHIPHPEAKKQDKVIVAEDYGRQEDLIRLREKLASTISTLRAKFLISLRAKKISKPLIDLEAGDLDVDVLYRLRSGDRRLFSTMTKTVELNTAVMILRDFSGSMGGKIEKERGACVAIVEALAQINIPTEVISFQNLSRIPIEYGGDTYKIYNRFEPFTFIIFKHFDEDYKRIKTRFVNYEYYPQGNNSDPEAIFFVAKRLSMRPEKRKILIVLTDGQPEAECSNRNALSTATVDVVKQVIKSGIEVIGIGMEYSNVKAYYPNNIMINNMNMLAPSLFKLLEKAKIGK